MPPLRLEDLDYELPAELIAQEPAARREDSRLLVVEREGGRLHDARFTDLGEWLQPNDALVVNETRVRPARMHLLRSTGARIEMLFVRPDSDGAWRVLARPAKKAVVGEALRTEDGSLVVEVVREGADGERFVRVVTGDLTAAFAEHGEMPLPPYVHRAPLAADRERYQTVYARTDGAVAAPTAGLHFSNALLEELDDAGIRHIPLLLHVGPGTFRPVTAADPREHQMDEEYFEVTEAIAEELRGVREAGGRIVAVGTTSVRALESACDANDGAIAAATGFTRKFIYPPYEFQAVDALITNFHLPRTSLLLLVAAFAGTDLLRRAYAHAVAERYRFYSYGDAMLIL